MRLRKDQVRARVKGGPRLRRALAAEDMDVDYGVCGMVSAVLALNVFRSFQRQTGAPVRLRSRKCTFPHRLQSLRTLR